MPKKTKKQKIIADYRKKILSLKNQQLINPTIDYQKTKISPSSTQKTKEKIEETIIEINNKEETVNEKNFFLTDIKKSLIVSLTVFIFLFLIYWLENYFHYFNFF